MTGRRVAEAFPPGEFIKDELEARGWSQSVLADILGRNTGTISQIISGKQPINSGLAKGLAAAFGTTAQFWMNLQSSYELWADGETDEKTVERKAALYDKVPLKEMLKRNWIENSESIEVLEQRVCEFLEVPDISTAPQLSYAARKSTSYATTHPSLAAWVKRAKHLAKTVPAEKYSENKLEIAIQQLKHFLPNTADIRRISKLLASAGVRLIVIEHLTQTRVDGATFWLDNEAPVIALSLRFDRLDNFWQTLLHEIKHVLNGDGKDDPCIDEDMESDEKPENEKQIDRWAASFSIDPAAVSDFIARTRPYFTPMAITGFAMKHKVHPAIAAGQVRHRTKNFSVLSTVVSAKVRHLLIGSVICDGWGTVLPTIH